MSAEKGSFMQSNIYVPDYNLWTKFFESRQTHEPKVGFQTKEDALKDIDQFQQLAGRQTEQVTSVEKQSENTPKIVKIITPTEQTFQQAKSDMKKKNNNTDSGKKSVIKKSYKIAKSRHQRSGQKKSKKRDIFNRDKLRDIFSTNVKRKLKFD
jgi:hypothetical protein